MSHFRVNNSPMISPLNFCRALLVLVSVSLSGNFAMAARVDDLYAATVSLSATANNPLKDAFERALEQVLVKVTGLPEAGRDAARVGLLPEASSLVQQYSRLPDNQLKANFDPRAIRAALDSAGLPVWGENRPLVIVWLALDEGGGERIILSDRSDGFSDGLAEVAAGPEVIQLDVLRDILEQSAQQRGLPVVLPLVDSQDLGLISFADIWGDFRGPVMQASQRYSADAILTGKADARDISNELIRWTITIGSERASWQGSIAAGPEQAAEFLAQRLATYADSADSIRVLVTNIDTLEKYGELKSYLGTLSIVEQATVARVDGDEIEFDLVVRGDRQRLERTLERSRFLLPASSETDMLEVGRLPDLVYAWSEDR
jgi:hypothetical protein